MGMVDVSVQTIGTDRKTRATVRISRFSLRRQCPVIKKKLDWTCVEISLNRTEAGYLILNVGSLWSGGCSPKAWKTKQPAARLRIFFAAISAVTEQLGTVRREKRTYSTYQAAIYARKLMRLTRMRSSSRRTGRDEEDARFNEAGSCEGAFLANIDELAASREATNPPPSGRPSSFLSWRRKRHDGQNCVNHFRMVCFSQDSGATDQQT